MEDQTEVIELEGKGRDPNQEARRQSRVTARANLLWMYLKSFEGDGKRHTQDELCEALGLGLNRQDLKEAVFELEDRGWLVVDRSHKPHRYTLN